MARVKQSRKRTDRPSENETGFTPRPSAKGVSREAIKKALGDASASCARVNNTRDEAAVTNCKLIQLEASVKLPLARAQQAGANGMAAVASRGAFHDGLSCLPSPRHPVYVWQDARQARR